MKKTKAVKQFIEYNIWRQLKYVSLLLIVFIDHTLVFLDRGFKNIRKISVLINLVINDQQTNALVKKKTVD